MACSPARWLGIAVLVLAAVGFAGCGGDERLATSGSAGTAFDASPAGAGGEAGQGSDGGGVGGQGGAGAGGVAGDTSFAVANLVLTLPATARPGETIDVSVSAENAGTAPWSVADVLLEFTGPAGWEAADLLLDADVQPAGAATFRAGLVVPIRLGSETLSWRASHAGTRFGDVVSRPIVLTCDDGVFCNGTEHLVGSVCVATPPPCDDGAACSTDSCDEATGRCSHSSGGACAACFSSCVPDCAGRECGGDGCGGSCGPCGTGEACASVAGTCQPDTQAGSCGNPLPLLGASEPLLGSHVISGDSTAGLHQATPVCNNSSTSVELVYGFSVAPGDGQVGIDARSSGYDTVLHIRTDCLDDAAGATVACSDDSGPPGDYGSRVAVPLDPGSYFLIVDGFDSTQYGPFQLDVKFLANGCIPQCDGKYCGGDDGCGQDCGSCGSGMKCEGFVCKADPCVPDCAGKQCGDDGCGASCGSCGAGELCVPATAQCEAFSTCDHLSPTCSPACAAGEYCGSDCACHAADAVLPDLVVDEQRLADEVVFDTVTVDAASCAVVEQCLGGVGARRVLRFSVEVVNQGQATLVVPPPSERPDLFEFSPCHGHYHFQGFASYRLLDAQGTTVVTGRKQAYCMEDSEQVVTGPAIACEKQFDCDTQGISAGWADLYGNALDCQWLDITGVAAGDYRVEVSINPGHDFEEASFDNNVSSIPVTIPPP